MSSCCDQSPARHTTARGALTVALAGNPNSGKTTIFNALTGLRQKVGNYPGVTVEKKVGRCKLPDGRWIDIIDLPGTYSLISRSPDETVAMEVLRGLLDQIPLPDVVVVVVDASNLQRNLYLVSQLIELGRPLVVALNMMDIAERRGIHVSAESLSKQLGVSVIPVVGHKRIGISDLKEAIGKAKVAPMPDWPLPQVMKDELMVVGGGLAILDSERTGLGTAISRVDGTPPDEKRLLDRYQAIAERLLIGDRAADLREIISREPVSSLLSQATGRMNELGIDPMQADIEAHYRWIEDVASRSTLGIEELAAMGNPAPAGWRADRPGQRHWTERIDSILIHKVWGLITFAIIMAALFVSIFWLAQPIMGAIEAGIAGLGHAITSRLGDGPIKDLINDGIFAGVGAVIVFVPQIALLFLFLAVLEDSGYLARAAFLMDRLLSKVGLHGKSFIPLLSSFACAIPGILATRTIENRKDRLATILVAPFMSCSARLPVYLLLIGAFFSGYSALAQAGIMLSLYALGIVTAAGVAWVFKRTLLRGPTPAFILEMPSYKVPQATEIARQVWTGVKEFLARAGTIIFCLSVILWAMAYYPRLPQSEADRIVTETRAAQPAQATAEEVQDAADRALGGAQLRQSIAGRIGHVIEPAIRPLGYDWKMGVGLIGAFAAREVFVSQMGIVYSVGDPGDQTMVLSDALRADVYPDGRPVWTPLVAVSLLVWFVLAMQCMSTLAVVRRETGGWRWPIFMLLYMNTLAYIVCLILYQVGSRLG